MILRCEQCGTAYHLDPSLLGPQGSKVRCTRCGHVFWVEPPATLEGNISAEEDSLSPSFPQAQEGKEEIPVTVSPSLRIFRIGAAALLLILIALSARFLYIRYHYPAWKMNEVWAEVFFLPSDPQGRRELRLVNHKKDFIENEKIGRIFLVEGEIINGYPTARQEIKIRGSLKTADHRVVDAREVYAGWALTREEIMTLSPEDLQRMQRLPADHPVKHLRVLPGKTLPFLILFPRPPQGATHISIEVLSSKPAPASRSLPSVSD